MVSIDHLVIAGDRLAAATRHVEDSLGLATVPGGQHPHFATHNRLLSLGPGAYVEAIAPDPSAPPPGRARWFGLDRYAADPPPPPRLVAWALRVDDPAAASAAAPEGIGPVLALERGAYRWRITVPESGVQPFDGLFPALIAWEGDMPPAALPASGAELVSLVLTHPQADRLGQALSTLTGDDRVSVRRGPPGLRAVIRTPAGEKVLA